MFPLITCGLNTSPDYRQAAACVGSMTPSVNCRLHQTIGRYQMGPVPVRTAQKVCGKRSLAKHAQMQCPDQDSVCLKNHTVTNPLAYELTPGLFAPLNVAHLKSAE